MAIVRGGGVSIRVSLRIASVGRASQMQYVWRAPLGNPSENSLDASDGAEGEGNYTTSRLNTINNTGTMQAVQTAGIVHRRHTSSDAKDYNAIGSIWECLNLSL